MKEYDMAIKLIVSRVDSTFAAKNCPNFLIFFIQKKQKFTPLEQAEIG